MAFALFGTLNAAELLVLRREYIRDLVIAYDEGPPVVEAVNLSAYNAATGLQWISDATINSVLSRIERDWQRELGSVYDDHYHDRLSYGDTDPTSDTSATSVQLDATMRILRSEIFRMMLNDAGFRGSILDERVRAEVIEYMGDQIAEDFAFMRSRASAPYSGVSLVRR